MGKKLNLYTHDGQFHADEVFATAMLSLLSDDVNIVRGSDLDLPEDRENWIIYDIGGGELDHHTPENKVNNGCHPNTDIPYAACGLVWRKYYKQILAAADCPEGYYEKVFQRLESTLILGIDAEDNGFSPVVSYTENLAQLQDFQREELLSRARINYTVTQMIRDFNPTWNSDMVYYDAFLDAVDFAQSILLNRIDSIISSLDARDFILRHIDYSADHLMILEEFAPWEGTLYSQRYNPKAADIWYVISPALRGGWNVQCALSDSNNRTDYRHPFPEEWYGLRYDELRKISGIQTAVFVHQSGFLAGTETQEDAVALAMTAASRKYGKE